MIDVVYWLWNEIKHKDETINELRRKIKILRSEYWLSKSIASNIQKSLNQTTKKLKSEHENTPNFSAKSESKISKDRLDNHIWQFSVNIITDELSPWSFENSSSASKSIHLQSNEKQLESSPI